MIKPLLFISFLILAAIQGFRWDVGTDFELYLNIFNSSPHITYSSDFVEIGYLYINKFFNILGLNFQSFLIIVAIIINFNFIKGSIVLSKDPISVFYFYVTTGIYFSTFNTIRQSIVVSVLFLSLTLIRDKKFLKFSAIVFLLFLIHRSALLAFSFIILYYIVISPILFFILSLIVITLINTSLSNVIIASLFNILPEKYLMYKEQIFIAEGIELINLLLPFLLMLFIIINYYRLIKLNFFNKFLINLFFAYFLLLVISTEYLLFYRVASYFQIAQILLLPQLLLLVRKKDRWILDVILVIAFSIFIIGKIILGHYGVLPYQTKL
ncbi:EpsG family protein [Halobacillus ihumii]|uniref:EpsG family protein n=1 Tax=Halobacillus ihumii TaxID=2686092 RepID=UPI003B83188C